MAQATLFVRHQVTDYAKWRDVYDTLDDLRARHGCTAQEVALNPTDSKDVFVLHRFPTVEQAQEFAGSDDLREAMGRAGVASAPRIEIAVGA